MSDQDPAPDPMDKAYAQAEAMLDDEAARAARRARVLGAVAREAEAPPAIPSRPRLSWRRGGWLAAACVAGLSALVTVRLYPTAVVRHEPPPANPPVAAAPAPAPAQPPAIAAPPAPGALAPIPRRAAAKPAGAKPAETRSALAGDAAAVSPPPPPTFQLPPAPAPPATEAPSQALEEAVVTARRAEPSAVRRAPSAAMEAFAPASPALGASRLRAAAAAGKVPELTMLLTQGAAIDAPDDKGETALMKAVQAHHPDAVALLRRRGADLDLKNRAGASARDMAASIDDPELNQALGLAP